MKKLIFNIFLLLASFGLLFLVSCGDDDDPVVINGGPSINLQVDGEATGPFEANIGQTLVLNLDVTDDDGVDSVVVRQFVGDTEITEAQQVVYPASPGGSVSQDVEIQIINVSANDEVRYEITAYDTEGNTTTETVVVNVSSVGRYTTVLLYAPLADESSESFFSTTTGETYSLSDVGMDQVAAQIDFGYYYGATNNATLASPQQIHNVGIYDLSTWSTLNTTQFRRTTISESEFLENESNQEFISGAFDDGEAGDDNEQVTNLQVGDIVAFRLSEGQQNYSGLVRVSNLEPGDGVNNYIEIDVLVSFVAGDPGTGDGDGAGEGETGG